MTAAPGAIKGNGLGWIVVPAPADAAKRAERGLNEKAKVNGKMDIVL